MYYRNQHACRVQSQTAELMLWITGHVQQHGIKKWGSMHIWTPTLAESEGVITPGPPQDYRHCSAVGPMLSNRLQSRPDVCMSSAIQGTTQNLVKHKNT